MQLLIDWAQKLDYHSFNTPALFVYSPLDAVVDPDLIEDAFHSWGGPKDRFVLDKSSKTSNHILAGDALNPQNTDMILEKTMSFLKTYLPPRDKN